MSQRTEGTFADDVPPQSPPSFLSRHFRATSFNTIRRKYAQLEQEPEREA